MNIIKFSGSVHFLFVLLLSRCLSGGSPSPFSQWALWNIVRRSFEGFQAQTSKGGKRVDSIRLPCNMVWFQFPLTLFFLTIFEFPGPSCHPFLPCGQISCLHFFSSPKSPNIAEDSATKVLWDKKSFRRIKRENKSLWTSTCKCSAFLIPLAQKMENMNCFLEIS